MSLRVVKKDIYSEDGVLLLAEGEVLTDAIIERLVDYWHKKRDRADNNSNGTNINIEKVVDKLKICDQKSINLASDLVNKIIFDSKSQPWWLLINSLSNHIDWLYTHSINVALISAMLAEKLRLSDQKEEITLGALLHDVGNLLIPKGILQKAKILTAEEMILIRQHCDLGVSMAKEYISDQTGIDIIRQHHERLDGSGYPQGLKNEQIPIHSKIVIVADIIDAITSYRPSRPARNIESVISELKGDAKKYPQDVVDAFISLMGY